MKAYSIDLRERVATTCAEPGATQTAVADRFFGSVSFVEKLRRRQRASGPAPLTQRPERSWGPACANSPVPPWTSYAWLAALGSPAVSPATVGRAVQALDWRQKKCPRLDERDIAYARALRAAFVEAVQIQNFTCFKFVDETSTNLTYGRRYSRAEGGQRAH